MPRDDRPIEAGARPDPAQHHTRDAMEFLTGTSQANRAHRLAAVPPLRAGSAPRDPAAPPPPQAGQSAEPDQVLAALPRKGKGGGREELRVSLCSYEGHPYMQLRLWYEAAPGVWRPTTKGVSVRRAELDVVRQALEQGAAAIEEAS